MPAKRSAERASSGRWASCGGHFRCAPRACGNDRRRAARGSNGTSGTGARGGSSSGTNSTRHCAAFRRFRGPPRRSRVRGRPRRRRSTARDQPPARPTARASPATGARGIGKSSRVKAAHALVTPRSREHGEASRPQAGRVPPQGIASLPLCLTHPRQADRRFIAFCDDLSFDKDDTSYKSLKAGLEGASRTGPTTWCSTPPPTAAT